MSPKATAVRQIVGSMVFPWVHAVFSLATSAFFLLQKAHEKRKAEAIETENIGLEADLRSSDDDFVIPSNVSKQSLASKRRKGALPSESRRLDR